MRMISCQTTLIEAYLELRHVTASVNNIHRLKPVGLDPRIYVKFPALTVLTSSLPPARINAGACVVHNSTDDRTVATPVLSITYQIFVEDAKAQFHVGIF